MAIRIQMFSLKEWGVTEHHNAMVFDAETVELPDGKEETKVSSTYMCTPSCTWGIFRRSRGVDQGFSHCPKFGLDYSKLALIFFNVNFD